MGIVAIILHLFILYYSFVGGLQVLVQNRKDLGLYHCEKATLLCIY